MSAEQVKINTVNLTTAKKMLETFYNSRESLMLWGKPSTAKSSIIKDFAIAKAKELGLEYSEEFFGAKYFTLKVITLSQMDSPDLRGMPCVSVDNNGKEITKFIPTEELPREGQGILFFDELNNGDETTLKAAYQIILDGKYGSLQRIKDSTGKDAFWRVAASNTEDDFCNTTPMPLALLRRFSHVEVMPTTEEVVNYFISMSEDARVIAYLQAYTADLFPTEWTDVLLTKKANPFPSQWQRISRLINGLKEGQDNSLIREIVTSCIGQGLAGKFMAFIKITNKIDWTKIYTDTEKEVKNLQATAGTDKTSLTYSLLSELTMRWKNNVSIKVMKKDIKLVDKIIVDVISNVDKEMQISFLKMLKQANAQRFIKLVTMNKEISNVAAELGKIVL